MKHIYKNKSKKNKTKNKTKNKPKPKMKGGTNKQSNIDSNFMVLVDNPIPFSLWNKLFNYYMIEIISSTDDIIGGFDLAFGTFGFGNDLIVYNIQNSYISMNEYNITCDNGLCKYIDETCSRTFKIYEPRSGYKEVLTTQQVVMNVD